MRIAVTLGSILLLTACKSSTPGPPAAAGATQPAASPTDAPITVTLLAKSGSTLKGSVAFTDTGKGVKVHLEVAGIPAGKHGVHIHEKPDCSSDDGSSAGGHYNPTNHDHALPPGEGHIGDLGNVEVGEDGKGTLEITIEKANLKEGDAASYRARSIIVHAAGDDGGQPTGNAGGRMGCAEIR